MSAVLENSHMISHRSVAIANLYHKQSIDLINLALTHNKLAIEGAHQRATELLAVEDSSKVSELVSLHMVSQIKDYLGFAADAYKLGFDAHIQASKLFHQQFTDGYSLSDEALKAHTFSGNPISSIAMTAVKTAFDTSQAAMETAKTAASKAANSSKNVSRNSK